ncbi:ABC transporter substrate-binding protein [Actinotalea sp.]|uniref:ABC transporter substrate-binding protein n=1 Tax=Actinotalea sp. TaxID=1872145 RepID=UPI002B855F13|nr:ABC transporter substrate-binding protein [Actinotalea sp.]HQY33184.1 ABC transporter substrate-binding protein [Actinotalea sp.]HRA49834.1 ABC transporter substrate-binding protein [Actinotalea sp.]
MRRRLLAAGAVALMLGLTACGGGSSTDDATEGTDGTATGGTLTLAPVVVAQPWDLKDAGLGNNTIYYQPVYDQLFRQSPEAEILPNLATEWAYDEALTSLTLTLREDVVFTDGTPFNAEAVVANIINTKGGTNEAANQLKSVESVEATDEFTAVITLNAPDPSLVFNLGSTAGMMACPAAIGTEELQVTPCGSGPYVLDEANSTVDAKYTFTRNADYWNTEAFPFDTIVLTPLTDSTAVLNALQAGQIDGATVTDAKNIATVEAAGLSTIVYPAGDTMGFFLWDRGGVIQPALGDVRVRQAINMAFDRETIVETALLGQGTVQNQVFNPDTAAYDEALNDLYPYDPERAKELLAEAGYADGFELVMPDLSAFNAGAQAAIVEQLGAVGITATLENAPLDTVINDLLAGKWAVSFFALASFRPWDTIQIQLTPDALWNPFKYEDPIVTDLITQAQFATGEEQDALFREINTYVTEQAWQAVWNATENTYAHSDRVSVVPQMFSPTPALYNFSPAS